MDSSSSKGRPPPAKCGESPINLSQAASQFPGFPQSSLDSQGTSPSAHSPWPQRDVAMGSQPLLTSRPRRCCSLLSSNSFLRRDRALYSRFGICQEREDNMCRPTVGGPGKQGTRSMNPGGGQVKPPQIREACPLGPRAPATPCRPAGCGDQDVGRGTASNVESGDNPNMPPPE